MIPRQHLGMLTLARGEPVEIDRLIGKCGLGGRGPALEVEVLAPAVEARALTPGLQDDPAHTSVTAREQAFDDPGLAVVVAEPDGLAVLAIGPDGIAQLRQSRISGLVIELGSPLEWRMRLGHEAPDGHGAADIATATHLPTDADDLGCQPRDLQDVLIGLRRQPAHEVELHLPPSRAVSGRDGADEVLLGHLLVDDLAHPLASALGREGEATAPTVA